MDFSTIVMVLVLVFIIRAAMRRITNPKCKPCDMRDSSPYRNRTAHRGSDGELYDVEIRGRKCNGCHTKLTKFTTTLQHEPAKVTTVSFIQTAR